ncbi:MAG TPA: 3-oxoacyl-[acyl-carrier-protein] synthase III C-terminal domain-containing protein [Opitutaceae bacterium]|jgi:3-oxoacyl-[acyl-carrier-protein] synthase III|nr:3-oxoacyl-[acyl-carrier-protein] synthase III C-terminal domain-containing protein [Opitutaceae bacterium]
MNNIIESLGIYLPPTELTTSDILAKCRNKVTFPLERVTGIRSRRVAGVTEFSIDLAKKAVARCLQNSGYEPADIDLLICCNISRYDGPDFAFTFEPSTAIRLRQHFGFDHAIAFDVMNACPGMFTGIAIADAALKAGQVRRAMVVSGEYISHLIQTAQKEINSFMDSRLACLTVGDAGAALILEPSADPALGFLDSEIFTLGDYSSYCVARMTDQEHGGAIMFTDAIKMAGVSIKAGVKHAAEVQQRNGWAPDGFDHLIMHQTSEVTLNDSAREINSHFGREICRGDNTICNLGQRGNTASTSHFVALADHILNGRIRSGQKLVFGISGSGLTIGTAIYVLDDLPDRMRRAELEERLPAKIKSSNGSAPLQQGGCLPRIRVESVATLDGSFSGLNSLTAARDAAKASLAGSVHDKKDIGLIIHAGVYRSDFISEPALATMLAGELGINSQANGGGGNRTLALDVFNGALGCLNACYVAAQMIWAKKCRIAMISASEVENNLLTSRPERRGLKETASSMILDGADGTKGFGRFLFRSSGEAANSYRSYTQFENGKTHLCFDPGDEDEAQQISLIIRMVHELLVQEGVGLDAVKVILPPQNTSAWIARLAAAMGLPLGRFVDATHSDGDLFTSSLPFALRRVQDERRAETGDLGLVIAVGSGRQIGCATYYF